MSKVSVIKATEINLDGLDEYSQKYLSPKRHFTAFEKFSNEVVSGEQQLKKDTDRNFQIKGEKGEGLSEEDRKHIGQHHSQEPATITNNLISFLMPKRLENKIGNNEIIFLKVVDFKPEYYKNNGKITHEIHVTQIKITIKHGSSEDLNTYFLPVSIKTNFVIDSRTGLKLEVEKEGSSKQIFKETTEKALHLDNIIFENNFYQKALTNNLNEESCEEELTKCIIEGILLNLKNKLEPYRKFNDKGIEKVLNVLENFNDPLEAACKIKNILGSEKTKSNQGFKFFSSNRSREQGRGKKYKVSYLNKLVNDIPDISKFEQKRSVELEQEISVELEQEISVELEQEISVELEQEISEELEPKRSVLSFLIDVLKKIANKMIDLLGRAAINSSMNRNPATMRFK